MTASVITGPQVDRFRLYALVSALQLEIKGMKRRGPSAYAILKSEHNLKGSRESVLSQARQLLAES
jgi:hypothetical protein